MGLPWIVEFLMPVITVVATTYFYLMDSAFWIFHLFTTRKFVTKPTDDVLMISATQAVEAIADRRITSFELVNSYIKRIEQVNGMINAMVIPCFEKARERAQIIDDDIAALDDDELKELLAKKPMLGVPFTMKDAMHVDGLTISCGVYHCKDRVSERTALVVQRMMEAGGILLGITNVPEVCMWCETSNTIYGRTMNPYDSRRMAGGSSGGEGALIGAAGSLVGIGSDIGGSIRMPSFFNGVFGMKTTPGIISLEGHIPEPTGEVYRKSMLRIGPMCRFAEDLPLCIKIMAGPEAEKLNLDEPVSMRKLRIFYMEGISGMPLIHPLSGEMRATLKKAVRYFERKYDLVSHRLDLPLVKHAMEYFLLSMRDPGGPVLGDYMMCYEGKGSRLNCLLELPKFFLGKSKHTFAAIALGIFDGQDLFGERLSNELIYKRDRLARELKELLGPDGILLFPSWPTTALFHNQPLLTPLNTSYTALFNALALPVVQCPMGLDSNGVPLGVQVVGAPLSDRILIAAAKDLEEGFGGWTPATPL